MIGLNFFSKTSSPTTWAVASYHDPASLTWSWCLYFSLFGDGEARVWPIWMSDCGTSRWKIRIPFIGFLRWSTQRKMLRGFAR